jgi:DNA repair exonuclease SbcCD ATPase subunit
MNIQFEFLSLKNFKSHSLLHLTFKEITRISGDNGQGKSSLAEAITWCLYGVDPLGSKMDPTPLNYDFDETLVELLILVDGKQIMLGRGIEKGKSKYYINEVPEKATPFDDLVNSLFDKNLFLSIFNPGYFFTQHWEKQRSQLLQYVSEPTNAEVLKELSKLDRESLADLLKKKSLDDIDKIHRENKTKQDKHYQQKSGSVSALEEQLQRNQHDYNSHNITETMHELNDQFAQVDEKIRQHNKVAQAANDKERQRTRVSAQFEAKKSEYLREKQSLERTKNEPIEDSCTTCGQHLPDEAIEKVQQYKAKQIAQQTEKLKALAEECKTLQEQVKSFGQPDEVENIDDLIDQRQQIKDKMMILERIGTLSKDIESAKQERDAARDSMNESTVLIDAVKAFRAKQAELMAGKVSALFKTLSIRLFDIQKNGEIKPTFEIEMDGKPYSKLSTAEKIRAGLELIEVLSNQSGVIAPTFVDNVESIMRFTKPSGQLVTARAVPEPFKIEYQVVEEAAAHV